MVGLDVILRHHSLWLGTTQDRDDDGDGVPDSSDRCHNTSNPRCFKEGA
jgi:hypothetical protein